MKRAKWLLVPLAACAGGDDGGAQPEPFELRPVVAARIAALVAEVGAPPAPAPLDAAGVEEVDGLVGMLADGDARFRELAVDAIRQDHLGPRATPRLAVLLGATERPWQERAAAGELLAALEHPAASGVLLDQLENSPEAWLRRWCAYHLSSTRADWIVPRLLLRLKYEQDPETFVWLATALGRLHNYSGLDALLDLSARGSDGVRAQAQAQLEALSRTAGLAADDLLRRWTSVDAGTLPQLVPSPALRLEAWRRVAAMNDDTIQLRGVDDARYVLSRLGPWAASELAPALADDDFHVRLHTAQVLERMGPRATAAGPALLRALAEPLLAPSAADALGRVGHPPARAALEQRAAPGQPHELRVACVRALGRLGLVDSVPRLQALFDDEGEPADLRMAAATALVLLEQGDGVARWLVGELTDPDGDPPAAELALETWLVRAHERGRSGFEAALEAWRAQVGPPGITPGLEQLQARRARRAGVLGERLEALAGG